VTGRGGAVGTKFLPPLNRILNNEAQYITISNRMVQYFYPSSDATAS
jgi:hypothetical protein